MSWLIAGATFVRKSPAASGRLLARLGVDGTDDARPRRAGTRHVVPRQQRAERHGELQRLWLGRRADIHRRHCIDVLPSLRGQPAPADEGRSQRALPVWQWPQVQEVLPLATVVQRLKPHGTERLRRAVQDNQPLHDCRF